MIQQLAEKTKQTRAYTIAKQRISRSFTSVEIHVNRDANRKQFRLCLVCGFNSRKCRKHLRQYAKRCGPVYCVFFLWIHNIPQNNMFSITMSLELQ